MRTLSFFILSLALLVLVYPEIDLSFSRLFYDDISTSFSYDGAVLHAISDGIQLLFHYLPWAILLLLILSLLPVAKNYLPNSRKIVFIVLVIIVGPGLIVNSLFKNHFGRARPAQIEEFGGTHHFTRALKISDQCEKNCSFVCGDAAGGFSFLALALLATRRRKVYMSMAIGAGFALGLMRIVQGAHFLSDVLYSGIFTVATVYFLYWSVILLPESIEQKKIIT